MRKWLIPVALGGALGIGWFGVESIGAAPAPVAIVESRPQQGRAAPLTPVTGPVPEVEAALIASAIYRPTAAVPLDDGRILVAEKSGVIRVLTGRVVLKEPFLDLNEAVPHHRPERGLLGLAVHPRYESNGRFFVHLTDRDGDSRLIEYSVSAEDPNRADPESARLVMYSEQPGEFHNGGTLEFGPDGYLWIGMGDGGFGDPAQNAQIKENVLGAILRIDVDAATPYAVPDSNPYVGTTLAPEIWFSGLRNPWQFAIDWQTRQMVIGDVGQFRWEEVMVVSLDDPALNMGWPVVEGRECYEADECDMSDFVLPHVAYSHASACAVVSGPVYRGSLISGLVGMVVYADYCSGEVRAFSLDGDEVVRDISLIEAGTYGPILSLAVDAAGEVLLLTEQGELRRLVAAA